MTFYEAALRVLEEAGSPLHSTDITKRAVEKGLLSHIGKTPEVTMLSRLAAMARRTRDRKVSVTEKDTFALTDWMLPEDADALAATGVVEPNPEEQLPPYRPTERHPEAHAEYLRSIGRQSDRKRRDDDKKKKFPPVAEVAFEVLSEGALALVPTELLARLKARDMVADELSIGQLIDALASDNQKRMDEGRKPQFSAVRVAETNELQLSLEPQAEGGPTPLEVQQAFCQAANLQFENGRVLLRSERRAQAVEQAIAPTTEDLALIQQARHAGKDARKAMARVLRKALAELELGTFEKSCVRMLHGLHFRELKVARRSKDGPLMTGRRREGSLELRYAIRLLKGGANVERRHVQELRRELQQTGANMGLLLTPGEARGEARGECTNGALVLLWAGDALADKFFEAKVGVTVTTIELYDIDEAFFAQAKVDAEESQRRREERHREKDSPRGGSADEVPVAATPPQGGAPIEAAGEPARDEGDEGEDGDEGPDEAGADAAPGEAGEGGEGGEGRRRRRRRRRRRGGANRPEGQPGAAVEGQASASASAEGGAPSEVAEVAEVAAPVEVSEAKAEEPAALPEAPPSAPTPLPAPDGGPTT